MSEEITRLEGVCEKQELAELKILQHALYTTIASYRDDPSAANKRNWDAANAGLTAAVERLTEKYFSNEKEEVFDTLIAAMRWLKERGYKIQKSKLYRDAKNGLIRVQKDGKVRKGEAEAYILRGALKQTEVIDQDKSDMLAAERFAAEVTKIKEQTRAIVLDREIKEGRYILKEKAIMDRVDQLTVLEANFRQVLHINMLDWCYIMGGNPDRVSEATRAADLNFDEMLNALSKSDGFTIEYLQDEAQGEDEIGRHDQEDADGAA